MSYEQRALGELIEQSEDLQSDSMGTTRTALAEMVDHGQERRASGGFDPEETGQYHSERRRVLRSGLLGLGGMLGAGMGVQLLNLFASPAYGQSSPDVSAAQTAASIENLAITVYGQAAALPFMKNIAAPAGPTIVAFVTKTVAQHTEHAKAFNAVATQLGGKAQTGPDMTVLNAVVKPALPTLKKPLDVVKFAAQLEFVAAQTYAAETAAVTDANLRKTFASIMGVENQHRAILLAVGALLEGNAPQLVMLGPPADKLPEAAGSVGFPDAFLKLDQARPADEGALK